MGGTDSKFNLNNILTEQSQIDKIKNYDFLHCEKKYQRNIASPLKQSDGHCPLKDSINDYQLDDHNKPNNINFSRNIYYNGENLESHSTCPSLHHCDNSQKISSRNNMPLVPQQLPGPLQDRNLSTQRSKSTIPKGGVETESTWTYPSPQMFYNSLRRKKKLGDIKEDDLESVVALHNNMNEKTWAKILEWENIFFHKNSNFSPENKSRTKLLKFTGRPYDLSLKARLKSWFFNHPLPFDRHDWTVVRSNGTETRYIIDYYFDESLANEKENSGIPDIHDHAAIKSILVDVRPAVDSLDNILCRIFLMPYARYIGRTTAFEPLPVMPTRKIRDQELINNKSTLGSIQRYLKKVSNGSYNSPANVSVRGSEQSTLNKEVSDISSGESMLTTNSLSSMIDECRHILKVIDKCSDEKECMNASIFFNMCMAKNICPLQYSTIKKVLNSDNLSYLENQPELINSDFLDIALKNTLLCVQQKSDDTCRLNCVVQKPHST